MIRVKYCLKCGRIIADNSLFKDDIVCCDCKIPLQEDKMTSEQFSLLSEQQKEEYTQSLYCKIKNSDIFDQNLCEYGNPNFYSSYWFEKYETLTGDVADRYGDDLKQHMQAKYGKNSQAYQEAVVQNCINAEKERKQESSNIPKCPICQSTNLSKISNVKKATKVGLFGLLGAGDIGKTWKCNSCGSRF